MKYKLMGLIIFIFSIALCQTSVTIADEIENELMTGHEVSGNLSLDAPVVEYSYRPSGLGWAVLSLTDFSTAAQLRVTVLTASGHVVAARGPLWLEDGVRFQVSPKQEYTIRIVLMGGITSTKFSLLADWESSSSQLQFNRSLEYEFTDGEDKLAFTLFANYDGYVDLLMTGGDYDLDLFVTAPDGTAYESRGYSSTENILFPVRAGNTYTVEVELYDGNGRQKIDFALTPYRAEARDRLEDGTQRSDQLSEVPLYYAIGPGGTGWMDILVTGEGTGDIDIMVYRDGELLADSIREGSEERIILGLQPEDEYLCKVYLAGEEDAGPIDFIIKTTNAAVLPAAMTSSLGTAVRGKLQADENPHGLFRFTAPGTGVAVLTLGYTSERDLDLAVGSPDGRVISSYDLAGTETILVNVYEGDEFYALVSLYDKEGFSGYNLVSEFIPSNEQEVGGPASEWYGLFIGIKDYMETDDLDYCSKDAYDFWRVTQRLGMRPENGRLLVDERATKANIEEGLKWLAQVTGPEDRAIVFFSGHGVREQGGVSANRERDKAQDYLVPYDSVNDSYRNDFSDDHFAELLDEVTADVQMVLLDICFAGGFREELEARAGRVVFMASGEDQESGESTLFKGGLLVGMLLREIEASVASGVPVGRLVTAARDGVPKICPECFENMGDARKVCPHCGANLSAGNERQRPVVTSNLDNDFQLVLP